MFMRAEIIAYDGESELYDLKYCDGPYLGDEEADGKENVDLPHKSEVFVRGVNGAFLIVDLYDNYGNNLPIFLLGISLLQIGRFVGYVATHPDETITASEPSAGPEWMWMRVVSE